MINLLHHSRRWLAGVVALATVMSVSGCSGITPDGTMTNEREEGPAQGLFTGQDGAFVLTAPLPSTTEKNEKELKDQE